MIEYKRCYQVDDRVIYDTFKDGFSDYIVKIDMKFDDFIKRFFTVDGNSRAYSHIAFDDEKGVGVIFGGINTYDNQKSIRCGALSISPKYRGTGVAQELLRLHKQTAIEQNCTQMVLEVIVGNDRAIHFYEKSGYEKMHDWYIYKNDNLEFLNNAETDNVEEIRVDELKNYRYKHVDYHIAWGNEIFCIEKRDAVHYGVFEDDKLVGAVSMQGGAILFLHVISEYRQKGCGKALIKKALSKDTKIIQTYFSAQTDLEQFLIKNGFEKEELAQYEMALQI